MFANKIGHGILNEASILLKSQNNPHLNEKVGLSFDELFKINSSKKDEEYEIEVNYEENDYKNIEETGNQNVYGEETNKVYNNNNRGKVKNKLENVNNEEKGTDKRELQTTGKEKVKNRILKSNFKKIKNAEMNVLNNLNKTKIKIKNLDFKTKEKIDNVINNFKAGRISELDANRIIASIIKNANIKGLKNLNKKNLKVTLNLKDKAENAVVSNGLKNKNINNKDQVVKGIEPKKYFDSSLFNTKSQNKMKAKKISLNAEKKSEGIDVKNFKSEIKLDINNLKSINNVSTKEVRSTPQNVLEANKKTLFQQVAKNTKIVLSQGQTKFSTMIRPENFGRIDFKFIVKDGKVNGRMILQNQETADFFRANVEELKAVFQKSNVELENIDIIMAGNNFAQSDSNQNKDGNFADEENLKIKSGVSGRRRMNNNENEITKAVNNYNNYSNSKVNLVV